MQPHRRPEEICPGYERLVYNRQKVRGIARSKR